MRALIALLFVVGIGAAMRWAARNPHRDGQRWAP